MIRLKTASLRRFAAAGLAVQLAVVSPDTAHSQMYAIAQKDGFVMHIDTTGFIASESEYIFRAVNVFERPKLAVFSVDPAVSIVYSKSIALEQLSCTRRTVNTIEILWFDEYDRLLRRERQRFSSSTINDAMWSSFYSPTCDSLARFSESVRSSPPMRLTTAQAHRADSLRLSEDILAASAPYVRRGFSFHSVGSLNPSYPQEFLDVPLESWLHRNTVLGRSPSCQREEDLIVCQYTARNAFVDAINTDITRGQPIRVSVSFAGDSAVRVHAMFSERLFQSGSRGGLDAAIQDHLTVLLGPPSQGSDLTTRTRTWRGDGVRIVRVLWTDDTASFIDWLWIREHR